MPTWGRGQDFEGLRGLIGGRIGLWGGRFEETIGLKGAEVSAYGFSFVNFSTS